jgi:hypothetical protein
VAAEKEIARVTHRSGPQLVLIGSPAERTLNYVLILCKRLIVRQAVEALPLLDWKM